MLHLITLAIDEYYGDEKCDPITAYCNLSYPVKGSALIRDHIAKAFERRSPYTVNSRQVILTNREVTKEKFLEKLLEIRDSIFPEDVLWIHLAGHAVLDSGKNEDLYFPQYADDPKNISNFRETRLSMGWIVDRLSSIDARTVILSIDACSASGASRPINDWLNLRYQSNGGPLGVLVLASAIKYERAKDIETSGKGTDFTTAILTQLDSPVRLTTRELYNRVRRRLSETISEQVPELDRIPGYGSDPDQEALNAATAADVDRQLELVLGSDTLLLKADS